MVLEQLSPIRISHGGSVRSVRRVLSSVRPSRTSSRRHHVVITHMAMSSACPSPLTHSLPPSRRMPPDAARLSPHRHHWRSHGWPWSGGGRVVEAMLGRLRAQLFAQRGDTVCSYDPHKRKRQPIAGVCARTDGPERRGLAWREQRPSLLLARDCTQLGRRCLAF